MADFQYSLFNKGLRVWLRNPDDSEAHGDAESGPPVWVKGTIIELLEDGHALVRTDAPPHIQLDVAVAELYPRNVQENVDDMVSYSNLHEAAILNNILVRYRDPELQQIYTMAGPILISVNPYTLVKDSEGVGIYDDKYISKYRSRPSQAALDVMSPESRKAASLGPHVFAVAEDTLVQFRKENKSQSVIISGESGSGKTECTKQIMQYLTVCADDSVTSSGESAEAMGPKLLRTNPILEALGNAKTVRNDNSSR
jgi:myosin heavy subunit